MGKSFGNSLELKPLATPANPPSGAYLLYFKSDGLLYRKDSSGTESQVGGGSSSAPTNMVTTDTAQSITAVKTFTSRTRVANIEAVSNNAVYSANATYDGANWYYITAGRAFMLQFEPSTGDLVLRTAVSGTAGGIISWTNRVTLGDSGVTDNGNRAYSDSNAPGTLEMTETTDTSAGTVPSGEATLYTTDGTTLKLKGDDGFTRTVGDNVGEYNATGDYSGTNPATPLFGVKMFSRYRARRMLAFMGPQGQDSRLQPFMGSNRIAYSRAVNNVAAFTTDGTSLTLLGTWVAVSNATTNFYSSMVRARQSSSTTAATGIGFRTATPTWFLSSTANTGGFHMIVRFGLGVISAGQRLFIGMSTTNAALSSSTNPTSLLSLVGFGVDSGGTTLRFITNDSSGTATSVDLGSNFATNTAATNFYEVGIFAPSGGGSQVHWNATRLNDGTTVNGVATTDLPALNTLMAAHVNYTNGTTAASVSLDVQSMYIETDN